MHFQIYVPAVPGRPATESSLESVGLAGMLANANRFDILDNGPDGGSGFMYCWTPQTGVYEPQNWTFFPASPWVDRQGRVWPAKRYWIGIRKGAPPTPEELAKPHQFRGSQVFLADGLPWTVPAAARLPHSYQINPLTGLVETLVREEFRGYWEEAQRWYLSLITVDLEEVTPEQITLWFDYCVEALSMNYRLPRDLVAHLRLIESNHLLKVAHATVERLAIELVEEDLQKKS